MAKPAVPVTIEAKSVKKTKVETFLLDTLPLAPAGACMRT